MDDGTQVEEINADEIEEEEEQMVFKTMSAEEEQQVVVKRAQQLVRDTVVLRNNKRLTRRRLMSTRMSTRVMTQRRDTSVRRGSFFGYKTYATTFVLSRQSSITCSFLLQISKEQETDRDPRR